jgi:hypothetical protein
MYFHLRIKTNMHHALQRLYLFTTITTTFVLVLHSMLVFFYVSCSLCNVVTFHYLKLHFIFCKYVLYIICHRYNNLRTVYKACTFIYILRLTCIRLCKGYIFLLPSLPRLCLYFIACLFSFTYPVAMFRHVRGIFVDALFFG